MSNSVEHLKREIARRGATDPEAIHSIIASERSRYWNHLLTTETDDARRRRALEDFDQAGAQVMADSGRGSPDGSKAQTEKKGLPRDILMVVIGAAIAVPGTLLANYLGNALFPQSTSVTVQTLGVQGVNAPRKEFVFLSPTARASFDGTIDVLYGMGVETANYKCSVKVSEPRHFATVNFDPTCHQVIFKFIDPSILFSKAAELNVGFNNTAVFSIVIQSTDGKIWRGSQGIEYAVNDPKLLR